MPKFKIRTFFIFTMVFLLLTVLASIRAESFTKDVGGLTSEEIKNFAEDIQNQTSQERLIPNNLQENYSDNNVFAFEYESATLYFNQPVLDSDSELISVSITNPQTIVVRDIKVGDTIEKLLDAFTNENESLYGDRNFAVLYLNESLPEALLWAWVLRGGQDIYGVEYYVHEQLQSGGEGYTDYGISYGIEEGVITDINIFGLNAIIDERDLYAKHQLLAQLSKDTSYFLFPTSSKGSDLEPFNREDLLFSGIDFLSITPQIARDLFGVPTFEEDLKDDDNWLKLYQWDGLEMMFSYDSAKNFEGLESISIDGLLEGPRGIKIGDNLTRVVKRFRYGEGELGDQVEILYGAPDEDHHGMIEYHSNDEAIVRYFMNLDENNKNEEIILYLTFLQGELENILILSYK